MMIPWHVQITRQRTVGFSVTQTDTWTGVIEMECTATERERQLMADLTIKNFLAGTAKTWPDPENSALLHYRCVPNEPRDMRFVMGEASLEEWSERLAGVRSAPGESP